MAVRTSRVAVAVRRTGTIDHDIAHGDVMKNATGTGCSGAVGGVARGRTRAAVFRGRKIVVHVVRVALRAALFLVHQRLDARHDGRGERRAARARPSAGRAHARRAAVDCVGPADTRSNVPTSRWPRTKRRRECRVRRRWEFPPRRLATWAWHSLCTFRRSRRKCRAIPLRSHSVRRFPPQPCDIHPPARSPSRRSSRRPYADGKPSVTAPAKLPAQESFQGISGM